MPKSGEFASAPARAVFAKERRGEVSRGAAARLPTALTLGSRPEPSHKASTGSGSGSGSKPSGNSSGTTASSILPRVKPMRDLNAGAGAGRAMSPQRQAERLASRLRGRSATQQSVRRVRPERTLGVGRTGGSRS